ncbi:MULTISPECIES: methylenetetrahydrofolate reductase [NAD(P)H] [Olivibacter]|jgi:methylenetetrahydrofolate reductase (NADPH)|uniref:Methylenetetrahydrofolate reductase n=2 Tax=Olivibacter TaxID=376469 RepID=A0ABV6HSS0_9SPHI|nr:MULTISPECIES: methylenetetrahydrofolate reductase [NAD(P)H] [Olivibacter]MCL4642317.1 methylenetetrahydrofolate reductase [NAD(P)H] [Olivibacter sp. UJ_SKK_5.1]MDM8174211.1 methylenetetrahydrofolate reductase [NAD(P)H] [Olivibacter sp. 47]MDX3917341.1 methylenetetrahydrofolate reductase [NAD(P)H] [Pseudosphingobacterium sp.]QEL04041.1 methylenetetrahydrofolate reductase [NAD(P)H] [Olivibacter sp. LS-1]
MKITDHISNAKNKTLISFELLPPIKGQSIQGIFNTIDPLMEFNPPFIDVTYLREDYIYKQHPNGLLEKVAYRKRPSTVATCAAIMNKYKVDAVPHLICGGFTKEETENALIDLQFLGIDNVLVLRGDARKSESSFVPTPGGHAYASDLLQHVVNMNNGQYLHDYMDNTEKTDFCIGVAGYPEKHFEAPNLETDFQYLKQKVDLGANFIVTQMFFDVNKYKAFVDKCRANDINIPIIPGLKPLTTSKQLTSLPKVFHLDIPLELSKAVQACKSEKEVKDVGIEWMIQQCKDLIKMGAPVLHFYTMGNPEPTKRIIQGVF